MGSWEDIKQGKDIESREIFSILKEVYSRKWYIGKGGGLRECERVSW